MKTLMMLVAVAALLSSPLATDTFAQRGPMGRGAGGWGPGSPYAGMYNPRTIVSIVGEVVLVERITPMEGMSVGIHVVLKTDAETLSVHLGPDWFIDNQDVKIALKDRIEVRGSRITFDGKPALIAAAVRKGDDVLILRDSTGYPMWSAWRRR